MKLARTFLLLALCSPAIAQDDPTKQPPAPAPAPKADVPAPAPEAKKERKVADAAMKALERHVGLLALPSSVGIKDLSGKGDLDQNGMTIGLNPRWSAEKGFDVELTLPDAIKQAAEAQGASAEDAERGVKQQLGMFLGLNALFEAPGKNWVHFDVTCKQEGDDQVVELTPFDKEADADSRKYVFGKDGLLKSTSMTPKSDANSQMPPGLTFDAELKFEKKGDRNRLAARPLTLMGQEVSTSFTYYDGPNGSFLPKEATISSGMQGDQTIKFHDYTVDGKLVEATKAEAAKPAEKPKDAPAPAEKPKEGPPAPAPVPPAPKDDPK